MRRWIAPAIVIALVAAACSAVSDGSQDGASATPTVLECELKSYPCSLSDVPIEILERSDAMSDEVVGMFESGRSVSDVDIWLNEQEGMVEVESDDLAVRFRLDGGRGTWILRKGAFATRGAPGAAGSYRKAVSPPGGPLFYVAGPETEFKRALVLSPMLWDFAETDDGFSVQAILDGTRGYEGRVSFAANGSPTASNVTVESFKGWENFQVVHVVTHGTRLCKDGPCRAVIAANTVRGEGPEGEGILTKAGKHATFTDRGLEIGKAEGSRELELEVPLGFVLLTADFFRAEYPGGLKDTLVFINACKTSGAEATDLADAIRGNSSVFLGWDESVDSVAAFAAAVALYEDLSEGYTVEVAYARLGGLKSDQSGTGAQFVFSKRDDGDGLRIRDVVELLDPGSGVPLDASSTVAIIGTRGDGEPDSVPYSVQIDGMTKELAPLVTLHVSIDGEEIEPQPITNGEVNDKDQWTVTGELPLGFDIEEDITVDFRAWVELPDGGESDDDTSARVTGSEPIMGYEWVMEATKVISHPDGRELASMAVLTLRFEEGQDVDEPFPRYVVTSGNVTYGDRSASALGCTYSGGGLTYQVTPDMSPPNGEDGRPDSVLIFDTTATPVEYYGVILTRGPDDTVEQDCTAIDPDTYGINTVSYGGNVAWMIVNAGDNLTVKDRTLIEARLPEASVVYEFTITRTK